MLAISSHAPSIMTQTEVHAPQDSFHLAKWMEWRFTFEILERLEWDVMRSQPKI